MHFAYFNLLWTAIQFVAKAPHFAAEVSWPGVLNLDLESFIEPLGILWFIYLVPVFFVVTKATRAVSPAVVWLVGAALEIAYVSTGWTVIDEFAARLVYISTGYLFATHIRSRGCRRAGARRPRARRLGSARGLRGVRRLVEAPVRLARPRPDWPAAGPAARLRPQLDRDLSRLPRRHGGTRATRGMRLDFLFVRPARFWLTPRRALQPAK